MKTLALLALALLAAPAMARDEERGPFQFGNVIYEVPDGWEKGRTDEAYVILYEDDGSGFIQIYRNAEVPADLAAWVADFAENDLEEEDGTVIGEPKVTAVQVGRTTVQMAMVAVDDGGQSIRMYVAMPVGDRVELVRFETRFRDEDDREDVNRLAAMMEPFLLGFKFVSKGASPLMGKPKPGPLEGVYFGSSLQFDPLGGGTRMQSDFYVFGRDGYFVDELHDGVSPVRPDLAALADRFPEDGGVYAIEGDEIVLRYVDGTVERDAFAIEVDGNAKRPSLELDGSALIPVDPPADGARLDGTWSSLSVHNTNPYSFDNNTQVSSGRHVTLRPDGTFERGGWSGFSGSSDMGDVRTSFAGHDDKPLVTGTYAIADGLITFTGDDGRRETQSILLVDDALLYLDGSQLLDRGKTDD